MGSGLVHANINNPPSTSKGKQKETLKNGLLVLQTVSSFVIHGNKTSLDPNSVHSFKQFIMTLKQRWKKILIP